MGTNTAGETLDGNTTIRLRQMGKQKYIPSQELSGLQVIQDLFFLLGGYHIHCLADQP